jgi:hypothetical protein
VRAHGAGRKTAGRGNRMGVDKAGDLRCRAGPLISFGPREILLLACWHVVVTRIGLNL